MSFEIGKIFSQKCQSLYILDKSFFLQVIVLVSFVPFSSTRSSIQVLNVQYFDVVESVPLLLFNALYTEIGVGAAPLKASYLMVLCMWLGEVTTVV